MICDDGVIYSADHYDPWPWVWATDEHSVSRDTLAADGVTYLLCETILGQPLAWAPLGSGKPLATGEGTHWRVRVVRPDKDSVA